MVSSLQQDEEQQQFWLCPGCSADKREKEKKEQLEMQAVPKTTPVKLAAADAVVKLPDSDDDDDDDDDDDEEKNGDGGEGAAGERKAGEVSNPREGGGSSSKAEATSAGDGKGDKSSGKANEKETPATRAGDGKSGPGGAAGNGPKAIENKPLEGAGVAVQGSPGGASAASGSAKA